MVLYTHNLSFARKYAREYGFETKDVWEISKQEGCFVGVFVTVQSCGKKRKLNRNFLETAAK